MALRAYHAVDPKKDIYDKIGDLSGIELFHNQVLVGTYERPEKTAGGIILTDKTKKEDQYQGKVGLVLKKGPAAFVDDERVKFYGKNVEIGDWVFYRAADGFQTLINGKHCRFLADQDVLGTVDQPDAIY